MRLCRSSSPVFVAFSLLLAAAGAAKDASAQQPSASKPAAPARPSAAAESATSSDTWAGPRKTPAAEQAKAAPRKQAVTKARRKGHKAKKERAPGEPVAMSPGFAMLQGGKSRIFVEVSKKVDVTEHKAQGRVIYRIKGASVPLRNNRLPLLTGFFPTPVMEARLVEQDDDVALVIDLRQATDVEHRIVESEGGIVVQVDFPAVKSFVPPAIPKAPGVNPPGGRSATEARKKVTETRKLKSSGEAED